jgi:hypothetical protein
MFENLKSFSGMFLIALIFIYPVTAQEVSNKLFAKDEATKRFEKKKVFEAIESQHSFDEKTSFFVGFNKKANRLQPKIGQDEPDAAGWKLRRGEKEIAVEVGFSPFQPTFLSGQKEYDTTGRKFGMLSLRWGRNIGTAKGVSFEYRIEIIPVALAFKNEVENPAYKDAQATPNISPTIRETTYGFGFTPAGFRFFFLPKKRLKPFLSAEAGFMFFKKPVPGPISTSYDFIGSFGGGLQYQIERDKAISIGYRYFHISNMNIGQMNPGYNANIFYIGYSFFYK